MNTTNPLSIGLSFVVPNEADSPFCWPDARAAAAFLLHLFDHLDYAMDLQADALSCVTLVTRKPLSETMGHMALYVRPIDAPECETREWLIEFDATAVGPLTTSDAYFFYLTRVLLGRLLGRLSGVLAVFDLDANESVQPTG